MMADEKNIRLHTASGGNHHMHADSQRLKQVFTNLLTNALQFTPDGGEVTAEVRGSNDDIEVTATDNGPGIPADALPLVFDRFWRGDKSRNRMGGGPGLGLAIVRQLVEAHSGTVDVDSELERGTTFTVTPPASKRSTTALQPHSG